jgi:hypothetical protein
MHDDKALFGGLTNVLRIPILAFSAILDGLAVFTVLIARFWCIKILESRYYTVVFNFAGG